MIAGKDGAYVAIEQWGDCNVCGNHRDLRMACASSVQITSLANRYQEGMSYGTQETPQTGGR